MGFNFKGIKQAAKAPEATADIGFQTHTISRERTNLETAKISTLPKFNIDLEKW